MGIPFAAIAGGMLMGGGVTQMFPPLSRWIGHGLNRSWRNEIVSVNDAIEGFYRGLITREDLEHELASTGLNDRRQEWLISLRKQVFGAVDAIILWRREEITDDELNKRLQMVGIPESDMPLWIKFTETRPTVRDIITFAVREVYNPVVAQNYGLFEGFEQLQATAAQDLKAAGILPDTLKKFWAAHWVLPSLQMGYEMLHRGVITKDELKVLLRTQDIMPFWQDKLIDISYSPLTRVDVRRMHKMGVITEDELVRAYKDIGYNEENAKRLADFTVAYNLEPEAIEETATDKEHNQWRELTKNDVISGYIDGLFTIDEATTALANLRYNTDDIDFLLSRADYQSTRDSINRLITAYRLAYIGNSMTHNEISDKLQELNLSGRRIENLFNVWDIEKSVRTNKPTKSEIMTFLRRGIIDKETARQELFGMGYNETYVGWYLATV